MDWNDIHEDLLDLILSNVLGKDRYSFSLVCHSWNKVVKASPYHPSPCLMTFNQRSNHLWKCFQHNGFFRMNFPILLKNAVVRFSTDGWLLMMSLDAQILFFFDPFNNQMIELPPIPSDNCMYSTICFFHPPTSRECVIIGILCQYDYEKIGVVLKYGEDKWKNRVLQGRDINKFEVSSGPPVLHNGKIYFLGVNGNVARFDMRDDIWTFDVFPSIFKRYWHIEERFLITPKNDEAIFAVFVVYHDRKVRVFELSDDKLEWKLVEDLHNRVFYVSKTSSFGYTTEDKSLANKIFFPMFHGDNVVFYSMDTQKYHSFEGDCSSNDCSDFTRLDLATWMIPTLCRPVQPSRELTWCKPESG